MEQGQFSMDDVEKIVANLVIVNYNEKKQLMAYIKQLEEKVRELEPKAPEVI